MGAHEAPATVPADFDLDGDGDGNDFAFFSVCFNHAGDPHFGNRNVIVNRMPQSGALSGPSI